MKGGSRLMIIRPLLLFLLISGVSHPAFAGPIQVESIQVLPAETSVGKYPEITGSVKANKNLARGETMNIVVIASVVRPDHVMKSWTWKKVSMRAGDIKSFTIPKEYEIKLAGSYKVDFNIYSKDMLPMHKRSTTFVVVDTSLQPASTTTPGSDRARAEASSVRAADRSAGSNHLGVGVYSNTLNSTVGATVILWPFKYVGLQGSYTAGSYTITEGRLLARLPLSSGINPYLGVGYLNVTTEKTVDVINTKEKFQDSGPSGVIGAEIPLGKDFFGYVEICGSSIDLKKEVTSGSITGTASVKYSNVSIGLGIVYFLF
jgi:hypothetical protein